MVVLVSIPNTIQTIQINNIDFNEMTKVNTDKPFYNEYKNCIDSDDTFVLCDDNFSTYGYISNEMLSKYPNSFVTTICNYELEHENNRIIVIKCNEEAIQAIVNFYYTDMWDMRYVQKINISDIIPEKYEKMKYKEQYIFGFLGLPSCYTDQEIHKYNSQLGNLNKKKKKKKVKEMSPKDKIISDFFEDVPEEYIDLIDDDIINQIIGDRIPNEYHYSDDDYIPDNYCGFDDHDYDYMC